jgi:hypothetical protein
MGQPRELIELANRLFDLRKTGRFILFLRVGAQNDETGSWTPLPNFSHDNVEVWIRRHPQYKPVRGWHIFDFSHSPFVSRPHFEFAPHSVISDLEGRLFDITPNAMSPPYSFIRHPGTNDEFDHLITKYGILHLKHYLDVL